MNRAELERLDREALVLRAEAAGVTRARILTRAELVDELVIRTTVDQAAKQKARGLFGRARDLLARVVEQGLHLPDAADRIRAMGGAPLARHSAPAALPTVTLAEIYAAQGHRSRAIETLERVLAREPDHSAASALLAQLRDSTFPVPPPRLPPEEAAPAVERAGVTAAGAATVVDAPPESEEPIPDSEAPPESAAATPAEPAEPTHMLDDAPLPPRYDVDECVAIPVDPSTLYVYWEVRDRTLDYVRATRPDGVLALRVVVIVPTWDGPRSSVRDHDVYSPIGDFFVRELPPGCVVRVAVGYRQGEAFVSIAHSPALETPPGTEAPVVADTLVRWTPDGAVAVSRSDPAAARVEPHPHRPRRGAGGFMDPERPETRSAHEASHASHAPHGSPNHAPHAGHVPHGASSGLPTPASEPMGSSELWAER